MEKLFPGSFLKNQNCAYLWIKSLKIYTIFLLYAKSRAIKILLKLSWRSLAFTSYKAFKENKKRSGTSLPASFSTWLLNKYFYCYVLLPEQISLSGALYFVRYWIICVLQLLVNQVVTCKFWNQPYLSNQVVFPTWLKSQNKNVNILKTKRAFKP